MAPVSYKTKLTMDGLRAEIRNTAESIKNAKFVFNWSRPEDEWSVISLVSRWVENRVFLQTMILQLYRVEKKKAIFSEVVYSAFASYTI